MINCSNIFVRSYSDFRITLKWKRANKTETTNERKKSDFIGLSNGYKRSWLWLVKRTLGWKKFMSENLLKINRYFALKSYCNTSGQSNNAFSISGFSLAGKRRGHVLVFSSRADKTNEWPLTETVFQGHTKIAQKIFFVWAVAADLYGWPLQWRSELRRTSMGKAYKSKNMKKSMNILIRLAEVCVILVYVPSSDWAQ